MGQAYNKIRIYKNSEGEIYGYAMGKKIIVTTGSYHKHYLNSLLEAKEKEYNFKLKEYFEK